MRKSEIHMHSIFSDGEFSPAELIGIAEKNEVSILSLTDHDTFDGIPEFLQSAEGTGITAFPGIEITVRFHEFNIHLLAYFKGYESLQPELKQRVQEMTATRETRMLQMIERVNEVVPERFRGTIEFENVKKAAEGVLARPHLAREMTRLGIVSNAGQAFERYLVKYNVERDNLDVQKAIELVRASKGVPVMAHPGERSYSLICPEKGREPENAPVLLKELRDMGLLGLECHYPYHERMGTVPYFVNLAESFDLIVTGSRDFHGFNTHQKVNIFGTTKMEPDFLEQFQEVWSS
ncbi:MAG: PHP domain-containing protein [Nitrospinaceae bacterium]|nr:PHP domain-containing protein [Nitrospina sp.]MBT5375815.1 PHP domain-containing protein [Nitrospinaceae bacterium]MBT5869614.1 PHP domain-containing protein [Nitrospinaceae bacterium]